MISAGRLSDAGTSRISRRIQRISPLVCRYRNCVTLAASADNSRLAATTALRSSGWIKSRQKCGPSRNMLAGIPIAASTLSLTEVMAKSRAGSVVNRIAGLELITKRRRSLAIRNSSRASRLWMAAPMIPAAARRPSSCAAGHSPSAP